MKYYLCFIGAFFQIFVADIAYSNEKCGKIQNISERLACYDMLYKPSVDASKKGNWVLTQEVSKIDDSINVFVMILSENDVIKRFGGSAPVTFLMRCMENTTSIYFSMDNFLSDIQSYGVITIRLDDQRAFDKRFVASTDNSALGLWRGGAAIPFLKQLKGKKRLIARITPFNESSVTAEFNIDGIDEYIDAIGKQCGW